MRRAQIALFSLVLLLVVPVAGAAADKPEAKRTAASIDTLRAVGVTDSHATVMARVVPGIEDVSAAFEYGPTTAYGSTAASQPSPLPKSGATASASIADLAPATTYHFRVVLNVADVAVPGPDATFTTAAAPAPEDGSGGNEGHDDNGRHEGNGKGEPAPVQAPAAPVLGESVAVGPRTGTVLVRKPNGKGFEPLTAGTNVPQGSVIDATDGTVALTSALDARGNVQTGEFSGGRFQVRQSKHGDGMIDIYLRGSVGPCRAAAARFASAARKPGRRSLWGRDSGGRFRTHGKDSVAAVRGTRWLTEDSCAGTRTRVTEGEVSVRDLHRKRSVTVRAGHSYLARAR
jgi:hypothetical protein